MHTHGSIEVLGSAPEAHRESHAGHVEHRESGNDPRQSREALQRQLDGRHPDPLSARQESTTVSMQTQAPTRQSHPEDHPVFSESPETFSKKTVLGGLGYAAVSAPLTAAALAAGGVAFSPVGLGVSAALGGVETYIGGTAHEMVWARKSKKPEESSTLWRVLKGIVSPISVPLGVARNLIAGSNDVPEDTMRVSKGAATSGLVTGALAGLGVGLATAALPATLIATGVAGLAGMGVYFNGEMFKRFFGSNSQEQRRNERRDIGTFGTFLRGLIPFGVPIGIVRNLTWNSGNERP